MLITYLLLIASCVARAGAALILAAFIAFMAFMAFAMIKDVGKEAATGNRICKCITHAYVMSRVSACVRVCVCTQYAKSSTQCACVCVCMCACMCMCVHVHVCACAYMSVTHACICSHVVTSHDEAPRRFLARMVRQVAFGVQTAAAETRDVYVQKSERR